MKQPRLAFIVALLSSACVGHGTWAADLQVEGKASPKFPVAVSYERRLGDLWGLSFEEDGSVRLFGGPALSSTKILREADRNALFAVLTSPDFARLVARLRVSKFRPGLSDLPEVELVLGDERIGYPVCNQGEEVQKLGAFADFVDRIVASYFQSELNRRLPRETCKAGQVFSGEPPH